MRSQVTHSARTHNVLHQIERHDLAYPLSEVEFDESRLVIGIALLLIEPKTPSSITAFYEQREQLTLWSHTGKIAI